ncbi:hypothetical protein BH10BAC3_BH10BAC3_03530 [soil metagenome]
MIRSCFLLWAALFCMSNLNAQGVAVNNSAASANASAILDVSSSQKGILIPRLTTVERDAVKSPATALLIFNSDLSQFQVNTGTAVNTVWQSIVSLNQPDASKSLWQTGGNKGLADTSFIGNADNKPLSFKTNNVLRLYIDSANSKVGIGTNAPRTSLDIATTDALIVPVGTTAQRPVAPVIGMIRFNATTNKLEGYTSTGWVALN